jgi:hypothetical protein
MSATGKLKFSQTPERAMPSDQELKEVREMIQALYRFANVPVWDGDVNEPVAQIFGKIIEETMKCSKALGWVPTPPGNVATISWLAKQLGKGILNSQQKRLSPVCARTAILKWKSALELASIGIAMAGTRKWG